MRGYTLVLRPSVAAYQNLLMYPKDSFFHIFWQQQMQAAAKNNARMMHWHPLTIRWCLSLRHKPIINSGLSSHMYGPVEHMKPYVIQDV